MAHIRWLFVVALTSACTGAPVSTSVTTSATTPASPTHCDGAHMRACYGDPVIVAGTGLIGAKGEDGWRPEYEGGPAIAAELSRPHFAMADGVGNIYIADKDANAVRRVALDGTITTLPGDYATPNGLWVRSDGTVYVLDLGHDEIVRVDAAGSVSPMFRVPGLSIGRGLWVDADETLAYVASGTRVMRWTPSAGVSTFVDGFVSLGNLTVDPSGLLVVTDRGAGRIIRIDEHGTKHPIAGNGLDRGGGDGQAALETSLTGVRGIWFTADGGYFLATHESDRVWYVDAEGIIHSFLDELSEVRGLSLDHADNLVIVDDDRGFVRVLQRLR